MVGLNPPVCNFGWKVADFDPARTGNGPRERIPSIGCSIKWRK